MKKVVLVTGGSGFIGANLVHELVATRPNDHIHVLAEPGSSQWRLTALQGTIQLHEISITNQQAVNKLVLALRPTEIYHLAAYGGMPDQQDQKLIFDVNLHGTMHLLNACKEVGFSVFINTGSSSEYGKKNIPMTETMPLEPLSDYAASKIAATHFCLKEALVHKLPIYTVRPFAVYGDYEMATRLIPTIITNALQHKQMALSSSHNVRDFLYIKDMVSLYFAIAKQLPTSAYVFNAGTGKQCSVQEVVSTVAALLGRPLDVQWGQAASRPWEPTSWQADNSLAKQILQWEPRYCLEQGLAESIAWFKNNSSFYTEKGINAHLPSTKQAAPPANTI